MELDWPGIVHADAAHLPRDRVRAGQQRWARCLRHRHGKEIDQQRLPLIGSGYSASPIAADGRIYLSNEDGEMLVIEVGPAFKHLTTNSIGETLMSTPALSQGVMYVRGARTPFAKVPGDRAVRVGASVQAS